MLKAPEKMLTGIKSKSNPPEYPQTRIMGARPEKLAGYGTTRLNLTDKQKTSVVGVSETKEAPAKRLGTYTHLDYFRGIGASIPQKDLPLLTDFVAGFKFHTRATWREPEGKYSLGKGCRSYAYAFGFARGGKILFDPPKEDGTVDLVLDLPGHYFEYLTLKDQYQLVRGLLGRYKLRCTRIDIAIDDWTRTLSLYVMAGAVDDFNYARAQVAKAIRDYNRAIGKKEFTIYIGSRESEKYVRCYDAATMHDGVDAIRVEGEFKRRQAQWIAESIANYQPHSTLERTVPLDFWEGQFQRMLAGYVLGAVDFVDQNTGHSNGTVASKERLQWWQDFIDLVDAEPQRVKLRTTPSTFKRTKEWIKRQVIKPLAKVKKVMGATAFGRWLREEMQQGELRFDARDWAYIEAALVDSLHYEYA